MLVRFFPCRVYIDLSCHDTLSYEWQLVVAVISYYGYCIFGLEDVGYGYAIRIIDIFTLLLALTSVNVLLVILVLVYRCKHNI
jgi:hypothetical protein